MLSKKAGNLCQKSRPIVQNTGEGGVCEKFLNCYCYAPINVNPEGEVVGQGGGDLTFLQKQKSNATPSGENSWAKFPTPGMKLYS